MRSNKKGFTLIELLAVIVILAIIALIATPIVLNIISKVRLSAAVDSVYGTMNSIEYVYYESVLTGEVTLPLIVTCEDHVCTYPNPETGSAPIAIVTKGKQPKTATFELTDKGTFKAITGTGDDKIEMANGITCTLSASQTVTCTQG